MEERLSRAEPLLKKEGIEKVKKAHVAVFGLGGVGSWCAEALVRSGVGEISLIDQDRVEESNINRQLLADYKTLSKLKTSVMAERLLVINPELRIHEYPE
ncbi:MAG: tRNA threonylcarbamoyladenosine dehydratase, partial [Clostridiales bacterium]|nr:tRNA threonylcarbamoyladenosine dehydratase [Clostridiales bacterium]